MALSDGLKNSGKGHVFSLHPLPWIMVLSYSVSLLQEHWGKTTYPHIPTMLLHFYNWVRFSCPRI